MANHPNRSQSAPHPTLGRVNYRDVRAAIAAWGDNPEFVAWARKFLRLHHATGIVATDTGVMQIGASGETVPRERLAEMLSWIETVDPGRVPTSSHSDGVAYYATQEQAEAAMVRRGYRPIRTAVYHTWHNDRAGYHGYVVRAVEPISLAPAFATVRSNADGEAAGLDRLQSVAPLDHQG